ncbi:diacylglycerol kinase family protein [bacterium]|nr:diacylglycerol kinase family protein [bacterium]
MVTLNSFKYAFKGLRLVLSSERNARIHLVFALMAVLLGFILQIEPSHWVLLILAIALVFFAEIVNTAIEKTLDLLATENNQIVRIVKDMTAAGVLVCAVAAVLIGVAVFLPKILQMLGR